MNVKACNVKARSPLPKAKLPKACPGQPCHATSSTHAGTCRSLPLPAVCVLPAALQLPRTDTRPRGPPSGGPQQADKHTHAPRPRSFIVLQRIGSPAAPRPSRQQRCGAHTYPTRPCQGPTAAPAALHLPLRLPIPAPAPRRRPSSPSPPYHAPFPPLPPRGFAAWCAWPLPQLASSPESVTSGLVTLGLPHLWCVSTKRTAARTHARTRQGGLHRC